MATFFSKLNSDVLFAAVCANEVIEINATTKKMIFFMIFSFCYFDEAKIYAI